MFLQEVAQPSIHFRLELPDTPVLAQIDHRLVTQALTNIVKYAQARRAWVTVARHDGHLVVEVGDDGVGGAAVGAGSGLQGLRDRLAAINGTLDVDSQFGRGTVVQGCLPIRGAGGPAAREAPDLLRAGSGQSH